MLAPCLLWSCCLLHAQFFLVLFLVALCCFYRLPGEETDVLQGSNEAEWLLLKNKSLDLTAMQSH